MNKFMFYPNNETKNVLQFSIVSSEQRSVSVSVNTEQAYVGERPTEVVQVRATLNGPRADSERSTTRTWDPYSRGDDDSRNYATI